MLSLHRHTLHCASQTPTVTIRAFETHMGKDRWWKSVTHRHTPHTFKHLKLSTDINVYTHVAKLCEFGVRISFVAKHLKNLNSQR